MQSIRVSHMLIVLMRMALACSLAMGVGCSSRLQRSEPPADVLVANRESMASSAQVLVVLGEGMSRFVQVWVIERDVSLVAGATCTGFRVDDASTVADGWRIALGPIPGVVGEKGFALPGSKREGDHRSPTGVFTITETFGVDPVAPTRLPYKVVSDRDAWCEDPASPNYNQWIILDDQDVATDRLKRGDDLYVHAAVIDYNRWPAIPGAGSAIFLHRADPEGAGTLGCVGIAPRELDAVLARLDPAARPVVMMGTLDGLAGTR